MSDQDDTDRMFPPPERPIPLRPSLREEFLAHHLAIRDELQRFRLELASALARVTPPPAETPSGALTKAKAAGLVGLRYGGVALAAGELAAALAKVAGHPEIEGPIRTLVSMFGGS